MVNVSAQSFNVRHVGAKTTNLLPKLLELTEKEVAVFMLTIPSPDDNIDNALLLLAVGERPNVTEYLQWQASVERYPSGVTKEQNQARQRQMRELAERVKKETEYVLFW